MRITALGAMVLFGLGSAYAAGVPTDQTKDGGAIPVRCVSGCSSGGGGSSTVNQGTAGTSPWPVAVTSTQTITATPVTLPAGVSTTLIGANANRKSLNWMNIGAAPMTCAPGTGAVTVGAGWNTDPPQSPNTQGGVRSFDGAPPPVNAFSCISTAGTKVMVWEGN